MSVHKHTLCARTHVKCVCILKVCPSLDSHQTSVHVCRPAVNFVTLSADLEDGSEDGPYPLSPLQEMVSMLEPYSDIF